MGVETRDVSWLIRSWLISWAMKEMKIKTTDHKMLSIPTAVLVVCLLLIPSTRVISADGFCNRPQPETISSIKAKLAAEVNTTEIVKLGDEKKMMPEDVKILQAYEKDGFILVSYQYSCCFEGMVVLFKKTEKELKEVSYYNGYDANGTFVGYDKNLVVRSFVDVVPMRVKGMIECYEDQAQQGGGTQSAR